MAGVWLHSALWLGLALLASLISIRVAISVALIEIVVGAVAGNLVGLQITDWVNFLAGFGAILLTFLAGTEIDPRIVTKHFWSSATIGVVGFIWACSACSPTRISSSAGRGRTRRSRAYPCRRPRLRSSTQ